MPWIIGIVMAIVKNNAAKIAGAVLGKVLGKATGDKAKEAVSNFNIPWAWLIGCVATALAIVVFGWWMYATGVTNERERWNERIVKEQTRQADVNRKALADAHRAADALRAQESARDALIKELTDEALAADRAGDACIDAAGSMRLNRIGRP